MRNQLILALILASTAFSVTACKSKVNQAPKAEVQEPAEKAAEPAKAEEEPAAAEAEETHTVPINLPTSKIEFIGAHPLSDHRGGFSKWDGTATLNAKNELQKLEFKIDMSSVYTDEDDVNLETYKQNDPSEPAVEQSRLDHHLMNEDFFDVPKYPTSGFVSTAFAAGGENGATHKVTGDLTLHGVTKTISFPATIVLQGGNMTAKADFWIDRFDFGIKYEGKKDRLIKKEVRLIINLAFPVTAPEAK